MDKTMVRKIILIQDIPEYLNYLKPLLARHLEIYRDANEEAAIHWIISETIEVAHNLIVLNHKCYSPYSLLYDSLDPEIKNRLLYYAFSYIKVPRLYGDNSVVRVDVRRNDLLLHYTQSTPPV